MSNYERMKKPLLTLLLLVVLPGVATAQNALDNGEFATDLAPWSDFSTGTNGTLEWSHFDIGGDPASGSLLVTNTSTEPLAHGNGMTQGVPVTGGKPYQLVIRAYVPAGQPPIGLATAELQFWKSTVADEPCGSHSNPIYWWLASHHLGNRTNALGRWETFTVTGVAPPDATCGFVDLETYKPNNQVEPDGRPFQAYFDDVELNEMLFVDGFETGSLAKWDQLPS